MRTAHTDRFVLERLPAAELLPEFRFERPEFHYPERLNAAAELIDRAVAAGWGARKAVLFPGGTWNYEDLARSANRAARVLVDDFALEPGARVLLRGVNGPMLSALWLAVLKAGAIAVATMPMLRSREISHILAKARINLSLCEESLLGELEAVADNGRVLGFSRDGRSLDTELEARMRNKPDEFMPVATCATDPALIAFTSGTTGEPKATVHFHRDVLAIADAFPRSILQTVGNDLLLCSAPFAFTFGLGGHLVFPLRCGGASVLLPSGSPEQFFDAIAEFRPTVVMTAPTAYRAMTSRAAKSDLGHVRRFVSAGEHLPLSTLKNWEAATGQSIVNGLGTTEMLHIVISNRPSDASSGATGRAVPGYFAAVLNDNLEPAACGETGRLAVKGPTGCRYLDDVRQADYVRRGWNLTGDACTMDADGFFWFQSRADDMIVSAGYNISGPEVEEVVLRHEWVQECAVVGAPDPERGQIVKAFVVLKAGRLGCMDLAREIQEFVKRDIAPFKYPRAIEFLDALPRNASGKIQRFVLRNR